MNTQITISVPTDWREVSISQYLGYTESISDNDNEEQNMAKLLFHFCGIKGNIIKHIKIKDLEKIQQSLSKLMTCPLNTKLIEKIDIDGVKYGFHPSIDEMTMGEFVDIDTHAKNGNMAKMLGVLYRPIVKEQGNRYSIEPYSFALHGENYKKFEKLSINIANAVSVFFWNLGGKLLIGSQAYLTKKEAKKVHQNMAGSIS
tara:strand:- start:1184 stop:1786 length:603 start_codon:yes stop_codon:yes gene_type:complete